MAAVGSPRALVVDDEMVVRRLVVKALSDRGFSCEAAADGDEAAQLLAAHRFDVLITDLRMPNRHGHSLVSDVLRDSDRPIIVVQTGVTEPKLARDLLARGVDDFILKPTDPYLLAAKIESLLDRRGGALRSAQPTPESAPHSTMASRLVAAETPAEAKIELSALEEKLVGISSVLPISKAALDVYHMTRTCDWQVSQIAAAIQRDPSLAAEVLRVANSSFYNATSKKIVSLDQAVMSIGQTRIGEMAVAINALSIVTPSAVPWMDLDLAWKRSMAAGVALEALIELGGHAGLEEGLSLSATMYPLGRIVLGALFPKLYERLVAHCWHDEQPLRHQERQALPLSHSASLALLLSTWQIPSDLCQPLRHAADDFSALTGLPEPTRTKAQLLKLAVMVGRLAIGNWETWDAVDFAPANVLERLKTPIVDDLLARIRSDVVKLARFRPDGTPSEGDDVAPPKLRAVAYCNVGNSYTDLLAELLPALGFQPHPVRVEDLRTLGVPAIINGLDAPATRFAACRGQAGALVVTTPERSGAYGKFAQTIALPCSFGRLRNTLIDAFGGRQTPVPNSRAAAAV